MSSSKTRYLMREVFDDGRAVRRPVDPASRKVPSSIPSFLKQDQTPRLARRDNVPSKVTTLRSTDVMSAQKAQRDLDSYWRQQTKKYGAADVRSPRPARQLPHAVSGKDMTPDAHQSHHSHYRFVKTRSRDDPRAQGVAPWEYTWRRPAGAAAQSYEKYDTARKVQTQALSSRAAAKTTSTHSKTEDMPPMPGSFGSLLKGRATDTLGEV